MIADSTEGELGLLTHNKGCRFSYLRSPLDRGLPPLVYHGVTPYNGGTKSKSFRILANESSSLLAPLLQGRSVTLLMTPGVDSRPQKKRVAPKKPIPVVIVPGPLFGSSQGSFLVSVVGRGSAVVHPGWETRTASLVLAGIPSNLAKALFDEIRRIFPRSHLCPRPPAAP